MEIWNKSSSESSLEALNLWDEDNPPQLKEIEEITKEDKNGLRMRFEINDVPVQKWIEKQERLNRFFVKGLESEFIIDDNKKEFDLILFIKYFYIFEKQIFSIQFKLQF